MTSVSVVSRVSRPAIRLRPVPPLDPPFDDEATPETWAAAYGAAQLTLDWSATTRDPTGRRSGSAPSGRVPASGPPAAAVAGASPEAKDAVRRFLGTCLEILNGYRPVGHLRPLSTAATTAVIAEQVTAAAGRVAELRRHAGPPRHVTRGTGAPPALVSVRRLRVCEPRAGAAEAAVVLGTAGRAWALALRLERRDGRWAATTVSLV
jgi:hypothetical protein